ncbi:MAG: hypothetical protein ACK5MT_07540 [Actinomycetales bacterium]
MSAPNSPDVPPVVGPFTIVAVLEATANGHLAVGRDVRGREVDLVLLSGDAGDDPAARDRFVGAGEALFRRDPGAVLGGSVTGARAWLAFPPGTAGERLQELLAAVEPGADATRRGPDFDPYWRGRGSHVGWQEGLAYWNTERGARPWWRYWWAILLALLMVALILLLLSQCQPTTSPDPTGSPSDSPTSSQSGSPSSQSPSSSSSSGTPSEAGSSPSSPDGSATRTVPGFGTSAPNPA